MEAAERQSLRCVWVAGGRALTEQEAAVAIVSEARLLLQEDLAQLGVQWDPTTLPPGAPVVNRPEGHGRESHTSSASCVSPREEQTDRIKDPRETDGVKTCVGRDTDKGGKENKAEYKHENEREARRAPGKSKSEDGVKNRKHDGNRRADGTEPVSKQTLAEVHAELRKETETDETSGKLTRAKDNKDPDEKREGGKQRGSEQEVREDNGLVSVPAESQQKNRPVPERSLTQELAEILSSPPPQPAPPLQPASSPMPPPRFRAPICQAEEQRSGPSGTSAGAGLVASPVQPGRLKHSRALSKVLHSIQADRGLQDNVQSPQSEPTGASVVQGPVPAGQVPSSDHPSDPVREMPAPTHVDMETFPLSVSPVSAPPEAKRRRTDSREVDRFSSPELYMGNELDEDVEGAVTEAGESFGDSFELDTQTERIIVQQVSQHRAGRDRDGSQPESEGDAVTAAAAAELDLNEGSNQLKSPENACPRFNISLTDSQMELILNTSQQVSNHKHDVLIINIKHR